MTTQNMMADPNELEIDLSLSENHVAELMESIVELGYMITPVTIWLDANRIRIIDGFHRTEAARRLGWSEMPVTIVPCDEEHFWSLRIEQARKHHEIEYDRLVAWMGECWAQTKWYIPVAADDKGLLPRAYSSAAVDLRMVEMIWTVFRKKRIGGYQIGLDNLSDDERELERWVDIRARQWGMGIETVTGVFLHKCGLRVSGVMGETYDQWARHYNLNFKQRLRLQKEIGREPEKYNQPSWDITEQFIAEKILTEIEDGEDIYAFTKRKNEERMVADAKVFEQKRAQRIALQQDPAWQREQERKRQEELLKYVTENLIDIRKIIRAGESDLKELSQGRTLFASLLGDLARTYRRLWPTAESVDVLVVAAEENNILRERVNELERENGVLKRDLEGRRKSAPAYQHMVLSGADIERMPA